jgi:hypothetical protein
MPQQRLDSSSHCLSSRASDPKPPHAPPSPQSAVSEDDDGSPMPTGRPRRNLKALVIAGAVVGALVGAGVFVGSIAYCIIRRQRANAELEAAFAAKFSGAGDGAGPKSPLPIAVTATATGAASLIPAISSGNNAAAPAEAASDTVSAM